MSLYQHTRTGFIRDLSPELIAGWAASGNPKGALWVPYTPPPEVPVAFTRADYKDALDAMLTAECNRYEFEGVQTLALYLIGTANKFQTRAQWLAALNIFTWQTSDDMAAQPPAGDPPTPEQFAGYILGLFEASNPRPV